MRILYYLRCTIICYLITEKFLGSMRSRKFLRSQVNLIFLMIENTDQTYAEIKEILYKQYLDRWQSQTVDSRVCPIFRTYRLLKTEIKLEPYLLVFKYSVTRRFLSRFRLSSHNLYIETGRWQRPKIPPEDRICPSCKNGVEDEIHVFVQCQRYNDLRPEGLILS